MEEILQRFADLKHSIVLKITEKKADNLIKAEERRKREEDEIRKRDGYISIYNKPVNDDYFSFSGLIERRKWRLEEDDKISGPIVEYIKMLKEIGFDEDANKLPLNNQCHCCKFYFQTELITNVQCLYKPHKIYKTTDFALCQFCRDIHLETNMPITNVEDYKTKLVLRKGEYFLPLEGLYFDDWFHEWINNFGYEYGLADIRFCCDWTEENDLKWNKMMTERI